VGEMLRLWEGRKDLSFVTLIPGDLRVAKGELEGFEPKRFTERVKRQMQRAGLSEITVVGGVDVSWEEDGDGESEGVWQPHLHMIVAGCSGEEIKKVLDRHYPRTPEVREPVDTPEVKDPVRQFSYCHKPFWQRRVSWTNPQGKRRRNPSIKALKAEQQREAALFGARLRPSELVLLMGVRQRGKKLVRGE
jgi:hypothetical protein